MEFSKNFFYGNILEIIWFTMSFNFKVLSLTVLEILRKNFNVDIKYQRLGMLELTLSRRFCIGKVKEIGKLSILSLEFWILFTEKCEREAVN